MMVDNHLKDTTAANEFPLRNLSNTFTIFNFNTFITFNITLTPLILYLANTLKIPAKYLYKKRLKSLLEVFYLATCMYNILKKLALSKLALINRKRYYIYQIYQMTEARLKKQVSYCLHFYCQKIKKHNQCSLLSQGKPAQKRNHGR